MYLNCFKQSCKSSTYDYTRYMLLKNFTQAKTYIFDIKHIPKLCFQKFTSINIHIFSSLFNVVCDFMYILQSSLSMLNIVQFEHA